MHSLPPSPPYPASPLMRIKDKLRNQFYHPSDMELRGCCGSYIWTFIWGSSWSGTGRVGVFFKGEGGKRASGDARGREEEERRNERVLFLVFCGGKIGRWRHIGREKGGGGVLHGGKEGGVETGGVFGGSW